MIKLKHILSELLLQEALPPSVAKQYTSIEQNPKIKERLDGIFKNLKELPNATTSKRGDRVYLPFTKSDATASTSPVEKEVVSSLPPEYKLKDYKKGVVTDKFGRDVKLNKILTKIGKSDLINKVNTDKTRESSKVDEYLIVFSRHPYDIAGMSTDRGWTSCMNIYDGEYKKYVSHDIREGSFICYITKSDDLNLTNPTARVLVKPYINIGNKNDVLYSTEAKYYGTLISGVKYYVEEVLSKVQGEKVGKFELVSSLYCDSRLSSITKLEPEIQNIFDGKTKATNKNQVKMILDVLGVSRPKFSFRSKYTINSDLTVDVAGGVIISSKKLKAIPVKFGKVGGDFWCVDNYLTTLDGAPNEVGGHFWCFDNKLTTLEGAPKEVGGDFNCSRNILTTLKGAPNKVSGDFRCHNNNLTTLEGAPNKVGGGFSCDDNNLTTLEGAPKEVGGEFSCDDNNLTTLEGAPKEVGRDFRCAGNKTQFTESDVKSVSNVKGKIIVK